MICKKCGKTKNRFRAEVRPTGVGYYYRDETGRMWQGRTCPECMWPSGSRKFGSSAASREFWTQPEARVRECRECGKSLPTDRYFKHRHCDAAHLACQRAEAGGDTESVWSMDDWGCGVSGLRGF